MQVVAVINHKGGVGKTTLTANLGAGLAARGQKVLLIDLDSQGSLSVSFFTQTEWMNDLMPSRTIKHWFDGIGTPDEVPATMSVPGAIHAVAPPLAFTALVAAIAVLAARMWRNGQRTTAVFSWVVAVVTFALSLPVWPSVVTIFVAIIVGFGWLTAYAVELSRSAPAQPA